MRRTSDPLRDRILVLLPTLSVSFRALNFDFSLPRSEYVILASVLLSVTSPVWYRISPTLPHKRARLRSCHRRSNACRRPELGGNLPAPHAFRPLHLYTDKRL